MGKAGAGFKGGIDFKRILNKYLKNWYLFVFAIAIAYFFATVKNRYVVPVYSLSSSVLIEDKSNKSVLDARGSISGDPLFLNSKLIQNQVAIMKSFSQIRKIIETLDFRVSYFARGKYIWEEVHKKAPFEVVYDTTHPQVKNQRFDVKFTDGGKLEIWSETYSAFSNPRAYRIDEQIIGKDYSFFIRIRDSLDIRKYSGKEYGFTINDINQVTSQYRKKTNISSEKEASVINISSSGPNRDKEKDYLNELTRMFLTSNLAKKNRILTSTIEFIDRQIIQMGVDLDSAEHDMEEFRKSNKFMQLSAKSATLLSDMNSESKSRANLVADLKYYEYLQDYIITHSAFEDIMMPSTVGISLPLFSDLVLKLSTVSLEKEDLIANSSRENPYIQTLEEQMSNMKAALLENITSIIKTTTIKIEDTDKRLAAKDAEFLTLPGIEREYLEIERKYNVFNNLYDFLLKRKSEVEIQRAANTPDHEIIDYAGDTGISIISASSKTAYINALLWAFLLPAIFLFAVVLLNNRIMSQDDIEAVTDIPVIGTLVRNTDKRNGRVLLSTSSHFTEMLRIIKIKLSLDSGKGEQVIAVTSAHLEDGKTFVAINLASVYALAGKRTLLLGFDLQRPRIAEAFELSRNEGITNFLINDISLDQVIQKTYTKNLDILLSGPIPPNHDELIESERTRDLFCQLRSKYEFIIMDTPATGVVGDAYLLNRFADITLFVVRYNHTTKKIFSEMLSEAVENKMKRIFIVLTDAKQKIKLRDRVFNQDEKSRAFILIRPFLIARRAMIELIRKF